MASSGAWAAPIALSNATLFNVDSTGTNLDTANGGATVAHGGYTTQPATQNLPGNYGYNLFLATIANPSPSQFVAPANPLALSLTPGANTFYFFADTYDPLGGTYGLGLNLWLNGAAASSPSISAYAPTGTLPSTSFAADATTGCTADFNFACRPGAGTLSATVGADTVTLTAFTIEGLGGAAANPGCVDRVGGSNSSGAIFNHPNGICDNYGTFTITVSAPPPTVAEPRSFALLGTGALVFLGLGRRRAARTPA